MKRFTRLAILGVSALAACAACADAPAVLAYWPFGESGLSDASGNHNTLEGGAVISDCATFAGAAGSVLSTVGNLDLSSCTDVTIEFFVKAKDNVGMARIVEQSSLMNSHVGAFHININERNVGEQRLHALWHPTSGEMDFACIDTVPGVIQDGLWHHVALVIKSQSSAVYDASALTNYCISFYIDGVASANHVRTSLNKRGPGPLISEKLFIGSCNNEKNFFTGQLDDIRVTAAALSPSEFLSSRSAANVLPEDLVVAYWPFGTNGYMDVSGNSNHLHASSAGVTLGNDGAVVLDGSQTFFQTRRPLDLRSFTEGLTVEFWFKCTGAPARVPFVCHSAATSGWIPRLMSACLTADAQVASYAGAYSETQNQICSTYTEGGAFADGAWHHVAWVCDPQNAANPLRLYVDGTSATGCSNPRRVPGLGNGFFRIGLGHAVAANAKFAGEIDDVRITAAVLGPSQFQSERTTDAGTPPAMPALEPYTLAHWSFDRLDPLADSAGLYDLQPQTNAVEFADGSAVFSGLGGLSTIMPLDLLPYDKLTVEFWVNYPHMRDRASEDKLFDMNFLELSESLDNHSGTFRFSSDVGYNNDPARAGVLFKTSGGYFGHLRPKNTFGDGGWHHWVWKVNRSGSQMSSTLTVDGATVAADNNAFKDKTLTAFPSVYKLNIGCRNKINGETWRDYKNLFGRMDDVRISVGDRSDLINTRSAEAAPAAPPLLRWTFDGENPLADSSGNGYDLNPHAGVTCSGGVASFAGTSGLAAAPLSVGAYKAFTVEMVFKTDNPYSDTQMLIEYGEHYQRSGGFYLLVEGNGYVRGGFDGNARIWRRKLNPSEWTHVALVIDSDQTARESQVELYVNGEKGEIHVARDNAGVLSGGVSLNLGARNKSSVRFAGAIDDVAISLGARTLDTFILSRPSPLVNNANDVIAYWPFNRGRELQDATGNGYSLANSAVTFDSAAAVFNGASTLVTEKMLPFRLQQGLTVECFMQLPAVLGGHLQETMVKTTLGTAASSPGAIKLEFYAAQTPYLMSRWMSGAFKDAGDNTVVLDNVDTSSGTGVTLTDGKWHHVAQVVDPTLPYGARSRLYVDGQEMPQSGSCDADRAQPFRDDVVVVGSDYFTGSIDDLRITGRALAPSEFLSRRSIPLGMTVILR